MASEEKQLPKPKRRRFQLGLQTLLVLFTLASERSAWSAGNWISDKVRRWRLSGWKRRVVRDLFDGKISSGLEISWWNKQTILGS
ncbi:hypothetical protein N9Z70_04660 [Mariniblastus sp.]|nr:hypothetical protein [Mariniblastus sp.]